MAIDDLRKSVIDSAEREAERLLAAAKDVAGRALSEKKAVLDAEHTRRAQTAIRSIDEEYARKLIQVRGANGKELLRKRNERLREIFDAAKVQVLSWPTQEYRSVMLAQLGRAAGGGGGTVRVHPSDYDIFTAILDELNAGRSPENRLEIDRSLPLANRGGFVFASGAFEIDRTIDTALADLEHELAPAIAVEVFEKR